MIADTRASIALYTDNFIRIVRGDPATGANSEHKNGRIQILAVLGGTGSGCDRFDHPAGAPVRSRVADYPIRTARGTRHGAARCGRAAGVGECARRHHLGGHERMFAPGYDKFARHTHASATRDKSDGIRTAAAPITAIPITGPTSRHAFLSQVPQSEPHFLHLVNHCGTTDLSDTTMSRNDRGEGVRARAGRYQDRREETHTEKLGKWRSPRAQNHESSRRIVDVGPSPPGRPYAGLG